MIDKAAGGAPRVRILDEAWDPRELDRDGESLVGCAAVVCLFYLDPLLRGRLERLLPCHGLEAVVGSEAEWGVGAYRLAERFVAAGPRYELPGSEGVDGEPWRAYLWEALYRELHHYQLLLGLAELGERLAQGGDLVFEGRLSRLQASIFEAILERHPGLRYQVCESTDTPTATGAPSRWRRWAARLREGWLAGSLGSELVDLAEGFDSGFAHRCRWGPRLWRPRATTGKPSEGAVVFLSAYANNSRSLALHRGAFEEAGDAPVHWLTITASARRGIPQAPTTSAGSWLWSYRADPASERRPESPMSLPEGDDGAPPGWETWHSVSPTVSSWLESQQDLARRLTGCFEAFLRQTQPRMVVVANQFSIEGWLARLAQRRGIPVVQVMHGVLGGHLYTRTPIVGDLLVTFGDFWRDLWPTEEREKIVVAASAQTPEPRRARVPGRRRLTFFSWDLKPLWGYGAADLRGSLAEILRRLLARDGVEVLVRCHPLENPAAFLDDWNRRLGPPPGLRVEKGGPLETVLAETDVALMFRSTLMLSCLARGIPIVVPGWIDFDFNEPLAKVPGVHLARDPDDLEGRLVSWLDTPPEIPRAAVAPLVAEPGSGREALATHLRNLLKGA